LLKYGISVALKAILRSNIILKKKNALFLLLRRLNIDI